MVVKRQCSFCADEIEPGTGTMFVKRDGTVFHFCSSSCRKQQLQLGRVGHRLKWTRAHALKRAAEQSAPSMSRAARARSAEATRRPTGGARTDRTRRPSETAAAIAPAPPVEPAAASSEVSKPPSTEPSETPTKEPTSKPKAKSRRPKTPSKPKEASAPE